ncbi:MAG: sugar phosphate isomerase/epimerase [Fuerstiella sp.]
MKFAICQELFEDTPWEEQCRIIAETGYTGIEVAPFAIAEDVRSVSDETLQQLRQTAEQHGLEIIGLHWLLAKTEGLYLTSPDAAVRSATADYLKLLARICHVLGGKVLVFGSPFQRNLLPGVTSEQALDYATEVFRSAMPTFAENDVQLCMEPLTKKETDFINTCAEAVELMQRVDHEAFVLHQDVKAMLGAETDSIPELIHRHKDICGHFHVNDTNLLGPGMGDTDYHPILKALRDVEYDGWISVEVFDYSPGAEKIAKKSLQYMRDVLNDLDADD